MSEELTRVEPLRGESALAPMELDQNPPELGYYVAALLSLRSALLEESDGPGHGS